MATTDSGEIDSGRIDSSPDGYVGATDLSLNLVDGVLSVTLNRPGSLNSLTAAMLDGLAETVQCAATDPRVKVVRLGGSGRGFCAGAGIGDDTVADPGATSTPHAVLAAANRAVTAIVALPKPAVAVVQGPAAGVGVSLALACDIVLASEKAFFMLAFTKIGLMPDGGASALIAAAVGRTRALRLGLLAERLPASDAQDWGLVTRTYPSDEFEAGVADVIATLLSGPAAAIRKTKQAINAATLTELDSAIDRETTGQLELLAKHDFREGTEAFRQRRAARFTDA